MTPLHMAARRQLTGIAQLLINDGDGDCCHHLVRAIARFYKRARQASTQLDVSCACDAAVQEAAETAARHRGATIVCYSDGALGKSHGSLLLHT